MSFLASLQRSILFSHLFLALCAVSLSISTSQFLQLSVSFSPSLGALASATVLYYNFHKFSYRLKSYRPDKIMRQLLASTVHPVDRYLFIIASLVFFAAFFYLDYNEMLVWLIIIFLALCYSLPLLHNGSAYQRLREMSLLKLFVVAFVWTAATVWLPVMSNLSLLSSYEVFTISFSRFTLVFALCIPFEIRDEKKEYIRGMNSIMKLGRQRIVVLTAVALIISVVFILSLWSDGNNNIALVAFVIPQLVSMFWLLHAKPDFPAWYYKGCVDGTMLLPLLFLILFSLCQ
ncbi:MAG: hypothetical protein RIQ47_1107 [Bacteroidota bacterium]|jgi:hypothetical protein